MATEFEDLVDPSSSPKKRTKSGGRAKGTKKNKKGTHTEKLEPVRFPNIFQRTAPKLGSFVRNASTTDRVGLVVGLASVPNRAEPHEEVAVAGENVSDDQADGEQTEAEEGLPVLETRPSGVSYHPSGHQDNAPSTQNSAFSRPSFQGAFDAPRFSDLRSMYGTSTSHGRSSAARGIWIRCQTIWPDGSFPGAIHFVEPASTGLPIQEFQ